MTVLDDPVVVRPRVEADDHACASIFEAGWNSALPNIRRSVAVDRFQEETRDEVLLVGVLGGRVVGFVAVWEPESFVHHLYVHPDFQRRGVGSALLRAVCDSATQRRVWLKVQTRNDRAIAFYAAKGFRPSGEFGEDEFGTWIAMELVLIR